MTYVRMCRTPARAALPRPGSRGLACAAAARRFAPTPLKLTVTPLRRPASLGRA